MKFSYECSDCGHKVHQWAGKCQSCQQWNSYQKLGAVKCSAGTSDYDVKRIGDATNEINERLKTGLDDVDMVFGGGISTGSLTLFGGEPGTGKSTLILQLLSMLPKNVKALYVSGEESLKQIAQRSHRLGLKCDKVEFLIETKWESIKSAIQKERPGFVIIDSLQTIRSVEEGGRRGSISMITDLTYEILELVKSSGITTIAISHINKMGDISGPKTLEHMVDTVITLELTSLSNVRMLKASKNRFGRVGGIGLLEMTEAGMVDLVTKNKLNWRKVGSLKGCAMSVVWENSRILLLEAQGLVGQTTNVSPKKVTTGYDNLRVTMLSTIIDRSLKLSISSRDVFVNIVGLNTSKNRNIDLAVIVAILSSFFDVEIRTDICFLGEVGLNGEIYPTERVGDKVVELEKQGFTQVYLAILHNQVPNSTIQLRNINSVTELLEVIQSGLLQ